MPHPLTLRQTTDPAFILQLRDRQYGAGLIAAALRHFDFFTWLHAHDGSRQEDICTHFSWATRPADVLLTLCRADGFLTNDATGGKATQITR